MFFGEVFSFAESYSGLWVRCGGDDLSVCFICCMEGKGVWEEFYCELCRKGVDQWKLYFTEM